jgi:AraC family transcriptional regulator
MEHAQEPRLVTLTATKVVGLQRKFIHGLSPDTTAPQVIGPLWLEFSPLKETVPNRVPGGPSFGLIWGGEKSTRSHPDELNYLACVEVTSLDDIPEGMSSREMPEVPYAVVTHRGPIGKIAETLKWLYETWLPESGFEHSGLADIELYDERFGGELETSEMDYFISIRSKMESLSDASSG